MSLDDLKAHCSTWDKPINTEYRGVTAIECRPNGQGIAALEEMNIASGCDLGSMDWDSPERLLLMIDSMRLAFADARQYVADPATTRVPVGFLLSKEYADQRRGL